MSLASPLVPLPPIPLRLELVPALLRRRGLAVSLDRLRQAAAAGWVPARRLAREAGHPAGGWCVEEADLGAVERYFRGADVRPGPAAHSRGAAAVEGALAREARRAGRR